MFFVIDTRKNGLYYGENRSSRFVNRFYYGENGKKRVFLCFFWRPKKQKTRPQHIKFVPRLIEDPLYQNRANGIGAVNSVLEYLKSAM